MQVVKLHAPAGLFTGKQSLGTHYIEEWWVSNVGLDGDGEE
jgi:hypothetical protein